MMTMGTVPFGTFVVNDAFVWFLEVKEYDTFIVCLLTIYLVSFLISDLSI